MSHLVLGISAFYHDSAAALVRDGEVVAAAQEERFSRRKHDPRFPAAAINYCLEEAFVEAAELDAVVFYDRPLLTFDRALRNALQIGPSGLRQFEALSTSLLGTKVHVAELTRRTLGRLGKRDELLVCSHHMAHAASAFLPSPFRESAILTVDGVGEWATLTIGRGGPEGIEILRQMDYPHSLGLLYSAATHYCGFRVNSGEYKLMGLAPYGEPRFEQAIHERLIDLREDGSFRLHTDMFAFLDGEAMTDESFEELFGAPRREPDAPITRHHMDVAASFQAVTESAMLGLARQAKELTGLDDLALAGGVALNCVANGRLLREGPFDRIWIQPAAGDAGGALGAALYAGDRAGMPRPWLEDGRPDGQSGSYLGPAFSSEEVRAFLDRRSLPYERILDPRERADRVAAAIADGRVVGFFSGRMEFGPRALGARSILGDPSRPDTQTTMNLRIKFRESFRPFAPSVLEEEAASHFDLDVASPYMLLVAEVREEHRLPFDRSDAWTEGDDMLPVIARARSHLPAITHVDYSARVQTVGAAAHDDYRFVLEALKRITGTGVVVNTSFNVRGEPIVCTPAEAYRCFMRTEMEVLVLEDCILMKSAQPPYEEDDAWKTRLLAEDDGRPAGGDPRPADSGASSEEFAEIGRIWREELAPLVGHEFFPTSPDPTRASYYSPVDAPAVAALRTIDCGTADEIAAALLEMWSDPGDAPLAGAAPALGDLAMRLRTVGESDGEPSDMIYTLF